jgi:transcriptional regulator with XRE-family HTH domain
MYAFHSDQEILRQIVSKLIVKRKYLKLTQKKLAENAGLSFRTIQKLEAGGNVTMLNFIAILRALGELALWDNLTSEEVPSPKSIHLLKKQKNEKKIN